MKTPDIIRVVKEAHKKPPVFNYENAPGLPQCTPIISLRKYTIFMSLQGREELPPKEFDEITSFLESLNEPYHIEPGELHRLYSRNINIWVREEQIIRDLLNYLNNM